MLVPDFCICGPPILMIRTMIIETMMWGTTRKNGVCPCSPLLGTPASSHSHPTDIGKSKWGTATLGLDSLFLKIWQATCTYLPISWIPVTTHTWFDSCIHYQHTGYTIFIINSSPSYKSLFKSKVRTYTSNLSREEADAGPQMSSKPAGIPCKNVCQKWGGENPVEFHSSFVILWETLWLIIPTLFTPQNIKCITIQINLT